MLNAIGTLILGIDAFIRKQWEFVLLEGVWSIVAIQGLFKYFNKKEVKKRYNWLYTKSGAWKNSIPGFQFLYTKRQISNIIKVYKNN